MVVGLEILQMLACISGFRLSRSLKGTRKGIGVDIGQNSKDTAMNMSFLLAILRN